MAINLPIPGAVTKAAETYALDLTERVLATFVVSAAGVAVAAGPADMFHASFWETVGAAGIAATGSLVKGILARAIGSKRSASIAPGV
ncbi:hypothetical protein [Peterkaempfera griseoplana]|uniref:hypothetical protein n=1 Tax=Peterkaempfera griseoplana TaxID=66896 RepID=UPI0006E2827E|nr:hypothetical protein [Peterkaempfera griseoplana]